MHLGKKVEVDRVDSVDSVDKGRRNKLSERENREECCDNGFHSPSEQC